MILLPECTVLLDTYMGKVLFTLLSPNSRMMTLKFWKIKFGKPILSITLIGMAHIMSPSTTVIIILMSSIEFVHLVLTLDQGGMGSGEPPISTLVMCWCVVAVGSPLFLARRGCQRSFC